MTTPAPWPVAWNGIDGSTGEPLRATCDQIVTQACRTPSDPSELAELRRYQDDRCKPHLDVRFGIDPRSLAEAGWGVVFPEGREAELREALAPLLALRREQASGLCEPRYREMVYRRGESKYQFLARHGVGPGPVDPDRCPYYLLLAGDPGEIPFQFQYRLDVQYAVGRLAFATTEEHARYAAQVVAKETGAAPPPARTATFFGTAHTGDEATMSSLRLLVSPLASRLASRRPDWRIETVLGPQATKAELAARLSGDQTPALLFTAGHGLVFRSGDPRHLPHQGALLCQDWPGPNDWRGAIPLDHYLAADDIADSAPPSGLIAFLFACYGAGTPCYASLTAEGPPQQITAESFVARLPQRLLGHPKGGALAVVGHVDRAWTFSFEWPGTGAQIQAFESALDRMLAGYPVGAAMEFFNQRYAELYTDLCEEREEIGWGVEPDAVAFSALWTAAQDARSYLVLGDPAVRLPAGSPPGEGDAG